jgi:glyoxylase-like metal-dependent hydrolase (beta-lactamase superfamily II)
MQLLNNLKTAGVDPASITKVLMTHLHKDHAGGVSLDGERQRLSLPVATYYIQERELEFALQTGTPSFIPEELEALRSSEQVVLLKDDEGTIDGYIRYQLTGAHSKFHQVFWITEGEETLFFGGDDAPQLQQMRVRYKTKYDYDPQKASDLRQKWWEEGSEWTFLFYHDIKTPFYRK